MRRSLSARRAWIEIWGNYIVIKMSESLSARRAWIEIGLALLPNKLAAVALRKESVDRNGISALKQTPLTGRSPQGERG